MAVSQHSSEALPAKPQWLRQFAVQDMWPSLAIAVMWLAVLFDALFGPDFVTTSATTMTRIPSAIFLAVFAYLATRVVARYGFRD